MDRIKHSFFLVNDEFLPASEFNPEIINRGTTIYELIKIRECTPLFLEKYLRRVHQSLKMIGHKGWISDSEIVGKIRQITARNCVRTEDHLKILISFENDLFFPPRDVIVLFFTTVPLPTPGQYSAGVRTISLNAMRIMPNAKIYQPQLRQMTEKMISSQDIYEVVLLNNSNYVTEGSRSNIFFIDREGNLVTPHLKDVLPGITRSNVIEIARQHGINVVEDRVHYDDLDGFDAAFLTGTSRKILPIKSIDNFSFNPQHGLLRRLMQWYDQLLDEYVERHRAQFRDVCDQCGDK